MTSHGEEAKHPNARPTVYFDGECPVCRREIAFMQSRRGSEAIEFADVTRAETTLPDGLSKDDALARFHVREADGTLRGGAAGFVAMWRALPGLRWLATIASLPGAIPVLERLYRIFLRIRPSIQRVVGAWDDRKLARRRVADR